MARERRASILLCASLLALAASHAGAATLDSVLAPLDGLVPELERTYQDLHRTPELSQREVTTARKMAEKLRALGFDVTTGVGSTGVVGLLRNGAGPIVMLRTDMDALPVEEKTGLPYASRVVAKNDAGESVPVMHACGHDIHMTCWVGTATLLARARDRWRGTLMMVAQPAEETGAGARGMLAAGLFTRFPKPTFAVAIHDNADLPAGQVSYTPGFSLANVDSVDISVFGVGGHGAYPHTTIDPVVIASRIVLSLQTIVSRENNPLDPAVVTVGSIHGGTKHNIVPDEVKLQLTVRSYKPEVRERLLAAISRIARAEAAAAGAPREPAVTITDGTPATYNDPDLTVRVVDAIRRRLGDANVHEQPPVMGGEDFSEYSRAGVPSVMFWVGAVEPGKFSSAKAGGERLPSLHSPFFAPDVPRTIRTGVVAETAAMLELLGKP